MPLFVDTACVPPFEDEIDWGSVVVRVDRKDVGSIADHLVASHEHVLGDPARSADALRSLWEDRLTEQGFHRHLVAALRKVL